MRSLATDEIGRRPNGRRRGHGTPPPPVHPERPLNDARSRRPEFHGTLRSCAKLCASSRAAAEPSGTPSVGAPGRRQHLVQIATGPNPGCEPCLLGLGWSSTPGVRCGNPPARGHRGKGSRVSLDQKRARWFGVLYLITFVTSIPALLLYEPALRHPVAFIAGAGNVNKIYLGALLELLLIIANIGTAVVIVPIMRRQFEELSIGYVTARIFECTFILVGIVAMLGIATLQQAGCGRGRRHGRLHARGDQGLDVPARAGLGRRLGERADPRLHDVPHGARAAAVDVARAHRRAADHHLRDGHPVRREPSEQHAALAARPRDDPGVRSGSCSSASTAPSGASGATPRFFPERDVTTQPSPTPHSPDAATGAHAPPWQRLMALSGVAFAPFFVIGWVTSVAKNPHYTAIRSGVDELGARQPVQEPHQCFRDAARSLHLPVLHRGDSERARNCGVLGSRLRTTRPRRVRRCANRHRRHDDGVHHDRRCELRGCRTQIPW